MSAEILLVEDNRLNRKLVSLFLQARGFAVSSVETVGEAERWLEGHRAALVLLDVALPGEDGLTLVRRLRARESLRTPVVALTAHAMPGDRERALAAGCDAYLSKPVHLGRLLSTVRELCAPAGKVP
jgi:two-component system cell cycle response regulator DivK